jgi:hypothetical protein
METLWFHGSDPVNIEWIEDWHYSEGDKVHGEFVGRDNTIKISLASKQPASTLVHEGWHAWVYRYGPDDMEKSDAEARRVENYIADLVVNSWELVKDLRREKLKERKM